MKACIWTRRVLAQGVRTAAGLGPWADILRMLVPLRPVPGHPGRLLRQLQRGRECPHRPRAREDKPRGEPPEAAGVVPGVPGGLQDQLGHQPLQPARGHAGAHRGAEPRALEGERTAALTGRHPKCPGKPLPGVGNGEGPEVSQATTPAGKPGPGSFFYLSNCKLLGFSLPRLSVLKARADSLLEYSGGQGPRYTRCWGMF